MDNKYAITEEEYKARRKEVSKENCDELDWSLEPHEPKEIIQRSIMHIDNENTSGYVKEENDIGYICWSYVCGFQKLDEELIKALMYISSGLFTIKCWDNKVIDFVIEIIKKGEDYNCQKDIENIAYGNSDIPKEYVLFCRKLIRQAKKDRKDKIEYYKEKLENAIRIKEELPSKIQEINKLISEENNEKKIKKLKDRKKTLQYRYDNADRGINYNKERLKFLTENIDSPYELYAKNRLDWIYIKSKQELSEEYMNEMECFF